MKPTCLPMLCCCLVGSSQALVVHLPSDTKRQRKGTLGRFVIPLYLSNNNNEDPPDEKEAETTVQLTDEEDVCFDGDNSCSLVYFDEDDFDSSTREATEDERRFSVFVDDLIRYIPIIAVLFTYLTYEIVADVFDLVIEALSNKNWETADGNAYEARIIAPAINGVVVPAISILFATLISNTVTTLRQRQLDIRTTINTEAGEIRVLQANVDAFPPGLAQDNCRLYLIQYTSRLIAESQPGVDLNSLELAGSIDSEMNGFLTQLNKLSTESSKCGTELPSSLLSETYGAVTRLNSERSTRITALQSTFPALHYVILSSLAGSIGIAFLMETNQDLLIFLNAIQLKVLWTILIATFTALGVVCYDLSDPFRGSYQISRSVDQLYTIRRAICASASMAQAERDKSSKTDV